MTHILRVYTWRARGVMYSPARFLACCSTVGSRESCTEYERATGDSFYGLTFSQFMLPPVASHARSLTVSQDLGRT